MFLFFVYLFLINFAPLDFFLYFSVSVPERLEFIVNKYAEHTHEKWSLDKVRP